MQFDDRFKVSVLVPTYNRANVIGRSIDSVLAQTFSDYEIIIVDDGSSDNTEDVVRQYVNKMPDRIKYVRLNKNNGAAAARNAGAKQATGYYLAFLDDDDEWHPDKLEIQLRPMLDDDSVDLTFSCMARYQGEELLYVVNGGIKWEKIRDNFLQKQLFDNYIGTPSMIIKRRSFLDMGGFNEDLGSMEDWEFAIRAAIRLHIDFVPATLMDVHVSEHSLTHNIDSYVDAWIFIFTNYVDYAKDRDAYTAQMFKQLVNIMDYICNTLFISKLYVPGLTDKIKSALCRTVVPLESTVDHYLKNARFTEREKESTKYVLSILIPIYNADKYLKECLDSILAESVGSMEIICINDGSTDDSPQILDEYSKKDNRIRVINKKNTGYGDSLNVGLREAKGCYIGILESDDTVVPGIIRKLFSKALATNADVVKGNYYVCNSLTGKKHIHGNFNSHKYDEIIDVQSDISLVYTAPSIWSGIYKRSFLDDNDIKFMSTPGASYQDTSFAFKVWSSAKTAYLVKEPVINYRVDSTGSSSNETKKIFDIFAETDEMDRFAVNRPEIRPVLEKVKFISFRWTLDRLSKEGKQLFIQKLSLELKRASSAGVLNRELWNDFEWELINSIAFNPERVTEWIRRENTVENYDNSNLIHIANSVKGIHPLYIFGAGIIGHRVKEKLLQYGITPDAYVVINKDDVEDADDLPVYEATAIDRDSLIIIGVEKKYYDEVISYLQSLNIHGYIELD